MLRNNAIHEKWEDEMTTVGFLIILGKNHSGLGLWLHTYGGWSCERFRMRYAENGGCSGGRMLVYS